MSIFLLGVGILSLVGYGIAVFFYIKAKERGQLLLSFDMVLFLVLMPKYDVQKGDLQKKEESEYIGYMEQIYANFLYLKKPGFLKSMITGLPRIAFEIASQTGGSDIEFYVAVPKNLDTVFEKYIQGVYPKAEVKRIQPVYTIFEPEGVRS